MITGSSIVLMRPGSGSFAGLSISCDLAVGRRHPVEHARRRRHQVHVELALEALLDDLHVQQARGTRSGSRSPSAAEVSGS